MSGRIQNRIRETNKSKDNTLGLECEGGSRIHENLLNSGNIVKLETTEFVNGMWKEKEKGLISRSYMIYIYTHICMYK